MSYTTLASVDWKRRGISASRQAATVLGLKGSQRIVLEELRPSLERGDDISVSLLANGTNYCPITVWTALQDLWNRRRGCESFSPRRSPGSVSPETLGSTHRPAPQNVITFRSASPAAVDAIAALTSSSG
jgi:hypothetical protein